MIKKRVSLLLGLLPLTIGCSGNGHYGNYVFQMGKSKDTHMGVSLKLLKDYYDPADSSKGQKYELTIDMFSSETEEKDSLATIISEMSPLTGYYTIDKTEKVYDEKRLHVGVSLLGEYDIPETLTDLVFVANINNNEVNFFLPVSLNDLMFQIYWYGYELNIAALLSEEEQDPLETPDGKHPVGSHPTQAEIDAINQHFKDSHGYAFRDYHVLKLGLTKQ